MPVVIGHAMFTPCFFASAQRNSLMVTSFPFGTRRMSSSTCLGAGTTMVPVPQRVVILPSIFPVFGKPLLSASFSRHDFFFALIAVHNRATPRQRLVEGFATPTETNRRQ